VKINANKVEKLCSLSVGPALPNDLCLMHVCVQVEKRLDLVKQVTHSTHKKLTACLQGHQGADVEKRSKKLPLTILAQCMEEGAAVLGDDSLLGKMLKLCGETEEKLAQELIQFEFQIERDVVEPLYVLAEVDIPNIQKQRKHLAKLVLDMDSARTSHPSTLQPGAKSESLREEMEETATRMEICRDQLSADMYNFVAKEIDYASYFQTLIETQAEYHRKSLEILQSILPQIKAHQEAWVEKPSFGKSLEEHLNISGREIAFPIEACVTMLLECGMQEEGLFRVAPSASKLKKLKASLDCGVLDVQEYSSDPHAIAGALKSYLRELPEPLMTTELYDEWLQASNIQDMDKRLQALMAACEKLPSDNLNNFRYLIKFLAKLGEYQDANKMTPGNMAIVLGPNLLWTHTEPNITEMMTTLSLQIVSIIEPIIQHADWFFPGGELSMLCMYHCNCKKQKKHQGLGLFIAFFSIQGPIGPIVFFSVSVCCSFCIFSLFVCLFVFLFCFLCFVCHFLCSWSYFAYFCYYYCYIFVFYLFVFKCCVYLELFCEFLLFCVFFCVFVF
uniref:Rho GTPase-activating protein 44 n=1 Tax=Gouania willdenowi TaxID=441366 RepID=A0A8C5E0E6_GOUWI